MAKHAFSGKWGIILYYVMQVAAGTEEKVEEQVKVMVGEEFYGSCFHPIRRVKKKFRGEWKEIQYNPFTIILNPFV